MRNLILGLLTIALTNTSFAANKKREPASNPPKVNELAAKLKREVRTRISTYNVPAEEANGCSDEGTHYTVKVQVKKAVRAADKDGNQTIKYTWETVREVETTEDGIPMEICME